jgi:hypothetical protein
VTDEYSTGAGLAAPPAARHRGRLLALAGTTAALLAVIAIELTASSGPDVSAPAQAVAAATRHATALSSVSATLVERVGAQATIRGRFAERRSPFLESIAVTDAAAGQLPVSVIVTDSAAYLKLGAALPSTPAAKWLKVGLSALGSGTPAASMLQTLAAENPMFALTTLAAGGHLRAVGTRRVGGAAAAGYSGSLTLAAAKRLLPAGSRVLFGSEVSAIRSAVGFTVWIDRRNRIRALTETATIGAVTAHVTITFYGFNQPVRITVPPPGQVVNLGGAHFSIS